MKIRDLSHQRKFKLGPGAIDHDAGGAIARHLANRDLYWIEPCWTDSPPRSVSLIESTVWTSPTCKYFSKAKGAAS